MGGGGEGGGGGGMKGGGGKREIIYLSLHCHHQNVSCIKKGSDESHFNVLLIVRDKVTRECNWLGAPASRYSADLKERILLLLLLVTLAKRQNIPRHFLALMTSHKTLGTVHNACQQAL